MNQYETLTEALSAVRKQGFTADFEVTPDGMKCQSTGKIFQPNDVQIVNHHRFEGPSSEDDMAVLYLLKCSNGTKGVLVDAYGTYANAAVAEFIRKVELVEE